MARAILAGNAAARGDGALYGHGTTLKAGAGMIEVEGLARMGEFGAKGVEARWGAGTKTRVRALVPAATVGMDDLLRPDEEGQHVLELFERHGACVSDVVE